MLQLRSSLISSLEIFATTVKSPEQAQLLVSTLQMATEVPDEVTYESQVGHKSQVTGYRLQVTGYRLQVTGHRLQVTGQCIMREMGVYHELVFVHSVTILLQVFLGLGTLDWVRFRKTSH